MFWKKRATTGEPAPTAGDFSPEAVRRSVLAETSQHPLTVLPAAVAAVSALYMGLMGLDPVAFSVALGSTLVAAGAFVVNYFFRGERFARRHVKRLRRQRREASLEPVQRLEEDSRSAGFARGAEQARELSQAYCTLIDLLKRTGGREESLNDQRLAVLTEDTYREGVRILARALELHRALGAVDPDKLRRELGAWTEASARREAPDAVLEGLQSKIEGHRRRLALVDERRVQLERLLTESELLEAALERTHLELVDLKSAEPLFSRGHAASELERAVTAARRVEEKLRASTGGPRDEDDIYLREEGSWHRK